MCFIGLQYLNLWVRALMVNKQQYVFQNHSQRIGDIMMLNSSGLKRRQISKTSWTVPCYAYFEQISTAGRVLDFGTGTRTNDMFKKQQANSQSKIMDTTIEPACKVHDMNDQERSKRLVQQSYFKLLHLHMVLEKKSTTNKFLSLQTD